jgi:hypothetical protein
MRVRHSIAESGLRARRTSSRDFRRSAICFATGAFRQGIRKASAGPARRNGPPARIAQALADGLPQRRSSHRR